MRGVALAATRAPAHISHAVLRRRRPHLPPWDYGRWRALQVFQVRASAPQRPIESDEEEEVTPSHRVVFSLFLVCMAQAAQQACRMGLSHGTLPRLYIHGVAYASTHYKLRWGGYYRTTFHVRQTFAFWGRASSLDARRSSPLLVRSRSCVRPLSFSDRGGTGPRASAGREIERVFQFIFLLR